MKVYQFACAAIVAVMMHGVALADDPDDRSMRTAAARARDREVIRQLNLQELARVRERDARYAQSARDRSSEGPGAGNAAVHAARSRDYERDMEGYARDRAQYERKMAAWRRAVAACRAGDYSACED